eukprot:m.35078 g.35078  ORF g.35078 m.35078 type:complete len:84 (+) comp12368_c0_seq1:136-387(+)
MMRLSHDAFLLQLTNYFETCKSADAGSIFISMKPLLHKTKKERAAQQAADEAVPLCLLRATLGRKKISTVVRLDSIELPRQLC